MAIHTTAWIPSTGSCGTIRPQSTPSRNTDAPASFASSISTLGADQKRKRSPGSGTLCHALTCVFCTPIQPAKLQPLLMAQISKRDRRSQILDETLPNSPQILATSRSIYIQRAQGRWPIQRRNSPPSLRNLLPLQETTAIGHHGGNIQQRHSEDITRNAIQVSELRTTRNATKYLIWQLRDARIG
jgi:hypothetical protein